MIELPPLGQFMVLLATHYVADFELQTHRQAANKSRNNKALIEHVLVYTAVLGIVSGFLFGFGALWFSFVWINAVLHFCTDYVTSRWSASHFRKAIRDTCWIAGFIECYKHDPTEADMRLMECNPGQHWHSFFGVIGRDQLIHQATLATTLWLIVA